VIAPKSERFAEFLNRLESAPPATSFETAYELVCTTMNAVEDELTAIPYAPGRWQSDGRLYPPQQDSIRDVPGHDNVKRFRSRSHNMYIGEDGAIEIRTVPDDQVIFQKPGSDGLDVWRHSEG